MFSGSMVQSVVLEFAKRNLYIEPGICNRSIHKPFTNEVLDYHFVVIFEKNIMKLQIKSQTG